jgi:hypothetical protein
MDVVLSGISVEGFKVTAVVGSLLIGIAVYLGFFRRWYWAIFATVFTYMILTAGVGVYVLMHITDPRWSVGRDPLLQAPSLGGTPVIGDMMRPLDDFLRDMAASVNEFTSFRHALPVAQDFFALAGWSLLVLIPVTIMALATSRFKSATLFLRFDRLAATVRELSAEVEKLKQQIPSGHEKPGDARGDDTDNR